MSKIEKLICDREFAYLQPYFYNNPHALRCELGTGRELNYMVNAKKRALEICSILFPDGADAFIFNYWITDYSDTGAGRCNNEGMGTDTEDLIQNTLDCEVAQLRFLLENQAKYRHISVRDLETHDCFDDEYAGKDRRNRIVCYADPDAKIDHTALVDMQINGKGCEIGNVSFKNECILSVYDDRGCDIVFATPEKMKEFYTHLEPYFLAYDLEEMKKRFHN